jgi:hypothetical protein
VAKERQAACKREVASLTELEAHAVSDADRMAAQAALKGGGSDVFTLGQITGLADAPGAAAQVPVAGGPAKTLNAIADAVVTRVRTESLAAVQASAHASELQAVAAVAKVQAASERSKLAAKRLATAGHSAPPEDPSPSPKPAASKAASSASAATATGQPAAATATGAASATASAKPAAATGAVSAAATGKPVAATGAASAAASGKPAASAAAAAASVPAQASVAAASAPAKK